MKISAKGRYALAAAVVMSFSYGSGEHTTVVKISDKLGISKIYLEQVFALLKRGGIVNAVKGSMGGYQLARMPGRITAYDILSAVESSLFEPTEHTVSEKAPEIDAAMRFSVFDNIDGALTNVLKAVTLDELAGETEKHLSEGAHMFYI